MVMMGKEKEEYCIPVIDVQDFPAQSERLIAACEEWGCFMITNHGISETLMSEMKAAAASLFDRPMEIKQRNCNAIIDRGYAVSKLNPLYEGMGVYDPTSPGTVHTFCSQLDATPNQRETILRYCEGIREVAVDIGNKLSKSLGLDRNMVTAWPCQFRLNKYNFTPETVGLTGGILHSDVGFFTVLQADDTVGGLEVVEDRSNSYVPVDPLPGTLFVNLGDMAKAWSNGRFHNVKHRVQCKEGKNRFSIALFVLGPKDEELVEAPSQLVGQDHPRLYVPFIFENYRMLRNSKRMPAGEALDLFRNNTIQNLCCDGLHGHLTSS